MRITSFRLLLLLEAVVLTLAFMKMGVGGWTAAGVLLAGLLAGTWIRSAWILPGILRRAEVLWDGGAAPSEVVAQLQGARYAQGELGYRIHLLSAQANLALGFKNRAWTEFLEGAFARLPLWKRVWVAPFFRKLPKDPGPWRFRYGRFLLKLAPRLPQIPYRMGILLIRRNEEGDLERAWEHFRTVPALAADDILILEDLMLAALNRGEFPTAEIALDVLLRRHGDPRLPWDRAMPSAFLLRQGRAADALVIFQSLPPRFRTEPWHWAGEARALRRLGDSEGAWTSLDQGLAQFPESFRLWMERYQMAMDRHLHEEARQCLARAEVALPRDDSPELRWEWQARRAEFAHWIDADARAAWDFLRSVPEDHRGQLHPPLDLELQVSLGDFENALARCKDLLTTSPGDPALLLLQGECLAGLEAWKALLSFLEGLGEEPRRRAAFWHLKGLALAHEGNSLGSRMDLERAALMEPNDLRLVLDAGHACADLSEWERSETHWRQALQLNESCEEALVQLSESRGALHDPDGARRFLRECLVHHPDSLEARERLSELESN